MSSRLIRNPTYKTMTPDKKKKKKMPKVARDGKKLRCYYAAGSNRGQRATPREEAGERRRFFRSGAGERRTAARHSRLDEPIEDTRERGSRGGARANPTYARVDPPTRRPRPPPPPGPAPRRGMPTRAPPRRPARRPDPPSRAAPRRTPPAPRTPPTSEPPRRFRAGYLKGYALPGGVRANSFNSHEDAKAAARANPDLVGGITKTTRYGKVQYQTRKGTSLKTSPKGEMSYIL